MDVDNDSDVNVGGVNVDVMWNICTYLFVPNCALCRNHKKTLLLLWGYLSPPSHRQKSFETFGLGSTLQILVANWKKIPASFTDKENF